MEKRGVSDVITTVLIVLLVLAAVALIGGILLKNLQESADKIESGFNTARLSVVPQSVRYGPDEQYNDKIEFNIQREPGAGNMVGLNLIFKYKSGKGVVVREDGEIKELETKSFSKELGQLNVDRNDIIKQISATPILKTSRGKEFFGDLLMDYRYDGVDYRASMINFMSEQEYSGEKVIATEDNAFGFTAIKQNGQVGENKIVKDIGPYDNEVVLWKVTQNGGFNIPDLAVNNREVYRFSVWLKKEGSGTSLFKLQDSGSSSERVFCNLGFDNLQSGKWYLFVGYLHAQGQSATGNSGIYDPDTGLKIEEISCSSLQYIDSRNDYYTSYKISFSGGNNDVQYFYTPRADLINGEEPSVGDLLRPYK